MDYRATPHTVVVGKDPETHCAKYFDMVGHGEGVKFRDVDVDTLSGNSILINVTFQLLGKPDFTRPTSAPH